LCRFNLQRDRTKALAAAGQYLTGPDIGERWGRINQVCGLLRLCQLQAASTAVTTAALILDGMAGTLQRREQCLTGLEFEVAPRGDQYGIRHGALMVGQLQAEAIQITGVHLAVDLAD
jgi:hypothetical protein